jgi:hypothetical protein
VLEFGEFSGLRVSTALDFSIGLLQDFVASDVAATCGAAE